jgi:FkbM family methyltransferase
MSPSSSPAPIALFAYRRPDHLARTIEALRANPEAGSTVLYVFSDAARDDTAEADVAAVRAVIAAAEGFAQVHPVYRDRNYGLARNITSGVSHVLSKHERVIVVEDDILVSEHFLRYMNEGLELYHDEPRIGSLSGYAYPTAAGIAETYLIRGADCWGWATWRDRWDHFEADGRKLLADIDARGLSHAFDLDGAMGYRNMLVDQIEGRNDSWAVRWHASCLLKGLLILYPGYSLVRNIGNDGSGTHFTQATPVFDGDISRIPIRHGGIAIEESAEALAAIRRFHIGEPASPPEVAVPREAPASRSLLRRVARRVLPRRARDLLRTLRARAMPPAAMPLPPPPAPTPEPVEQVPATRYRGLQEIDRQIEKYLDFDNGFFVELGANDGLFQSNSWYYETYRNWRGVLVEPAPNLFLECRKNRSERTHVVCAACVSFDYADEFVRIVYSNAMSVSMGVETDLADPQAHAELGRQFLRPGETVFTFGALARPLNAILSEAGAPALIDFLSLDVEGAEIEVLKGVDHETHRFRHMLIECRDIARLERYLAPLGYRLAERFNEHDYLFMPLDEPGTRSNARQVSARDSQTEALPAPFSIPGPDGAR